AGRARPLARGHLDPGRHTRRPLSRQQTGIAVRPVARAELALNARLVNSCLVLGVEIDGQQVTTVEGLSSWRGLHPIQQAFVDADAIQCGYCAPGILIASKALLDREPQPSAERIRTWLASNLSLHGI
ncbi:MAG TPA: 2Fe-2S iron-sulfur cluster-binding protein, partial [Anaerolineae bacterium]|nr:2Fe-2S iron-sulfur cluster-binding protein [Anaerolineae bacterium]